MVLYPVYIAYERRLFSSPCLCYRMLVTRHGCGVHVCRAAQLLHYL